MYKRVLEQDYLQEVQEIGSIDEIGIDNKNCAEELFELSETLKSESVASANRNCEPDDRTWLLETIETLKSPTSTKSLDLRGIWCGTEGAVKLSEALKTNTSVTSLKMFWCMIGDEGIIKLSEALKRNTSLTSLNLSFCDIGKKGMSILSEVLKSNTSLTSIDLSCNKFGNKGAAKLAEALKSNSTLISLDLSGNKIDTVGAVKLAEALKSNSTVTSLELLHSKIAIPIPAEVLQTIAEKISQNRTIWRDVHYCIRMNELQQLRTLLPEHSINLNSINLSTNEEDTVLHSAAKSNCVHMIAYVLKNMSSSARERMLKMKNKEGQLPSDLLTVCAPSIHSLFPLKFRQVVKAVLMLGAKRQDGTPYYPQTHFYKLPKEIIFEILQFALPCYE